ncbi:MAG: phosphopentomutase [Atribacterota bacterium]
MRIFIALLDGVGMGELPDAGHYGDEGSHTLRNLSRAVGGLCCPTLERLGLGLIEPIPGIALLQPAEGGYGKMAERSPGKDTTVGHWEMMGAVIDRPFPVYPQGFPNRLMKKIEAVTGSRFLGNKPASGTAIIEEYGPEHIRTGFPIIYTSADSVLQIAAHEDLISPEELYHLCRSVRMVMEGEDAVARVIARPFVGNPGDFHRTPRRKDFSLPPPYPTVLDALVEHGKRTAGVGKIGDIFTGRGISESFKTTSNADTFRVFFELQADQHFDLVWANFNDFDSIYGHRNNVSGFKSALESWDAQLSEFLPRLRSNDILIITSDHGCDPTTPSTDHSREYALLLVASPSIYSGFSLGIRESFADIGATVAEGLEVVWRGPGMSFMSEWLVTASQFFPSLILI